MPTNITDVDTFTDPVTRPSDGEAANGASIGTTAQALANRTRILKNRVDALAASYTVTRLVGVISNGYPFQTEWETTTGGIYWLSAANNGTLYIDLNGGLVHGASLTSVRVRVNPGTARAASSNMSARIYRQPRDGSAAVLLSAEVFDDETADPQDITVTPSASHTIDTSAYVYQLRVDGGSDAATNKDTCLGGVECICVVPAVTYP